MKRDDMDLTNLAPSQDGLPSTDRQAKPRLAQDSASSGVILGTIVPYVGSGAHVDFT